jgi:hypothetical protein
MPGVPESEFAIKNTMDRRNRGWRLDPTDSAPPEAVSISTGVGTYFAFSA